MIKEPKNLDFYVLDKPWTEEERKEFSAYIKERKAQQQKEIKKTSGRKKKVTF